MVNVFRRYARAERSQPFQFSLHTIAFQVEMDAVLHRLTKSGHGYDHAPADQVQVAPLRVKVVGGASLLVQVPWKPTVTELPAAMAPL